MLDEITKKMIEQLDAANPTLRLWIGRLFIGAIIADGIIETNEQPILKQLLEYSVQDSNLKDELLGLIKTKQIPTLEPIEVSLKEARSILKLALEICCCDDELHYQEIQLIQEAGAALGMPPVKIHVLIDQNLLRMKSHSFDKVIVDLNKPQKRWLSLVILKLILADQKIDKKEFWYFSDIYDLDEDPKALYDMVKSDPKQYFIDQLPEIHFDQEHAENILKYLLILAVSDRHFDKDEEQALREVSQLIEYDQEAFEQMLLATKRSLGLV